MTDQRPDDEFSRICRAEINALTDDFSRTGAASRIVTWVTAQQRHVTRQSFWRNLLLRPVFIAGLASIAGLGIGVAVTTAFMWRDVVIANSALLPLSVREIKFDSSKQAAGFAAIVQ